MITRCNSSGPLYTMCLLSHLTPSSPVSAPSALVASTSTLNRRLSHPSVDVLSKLSYDSSVVCSRHTHDLCHACQLGHPIRLPFVSSNSRVDNFFDLIHCDLWTSPVVSVSGYKYYLIILDDHSHFVWTFPLHVKSDTFFTLSIFSLMSLHSLATSSKPSSATIVASLITPPLAHSSPSKGYFCGCIVHTPLRRTVKPSASFASLIICYVPCFLGFCSISPLGRSAPHRLIFVESPPHKAISTTNPYFTLHGVTPSYEHLHVFGCACYPNLSAKATNKLAPRFTRCIFLGYSAGHKGYQCLDLTTNNIVVSRHVVYDETDFP
jgi:hypothetical protein